MKETKRCITCGFLNVPSAFRGDSDICRECTREIRRFKSKIHNLIRFSVKYDTISYIWKYLPFDARTLKNHLESQFEFWMHWKNQGKYKISDWNDNDASTWFWQIDHIIPQGAFLFTSVEDEAFRLCWSLDNLRPISAKANALKNRKLVL
jgi:hypothetical protein